MNKFKLNDTVRSLKTGKRGLVQATYPECSHGGGRFLLYHGDGYEHLCEEEMEHILESEVPFRVDLYKTST